MLDWKRKPKESLELEEVEEVIEVGFLQIVTSLLLIDRSSTPRLILRQGHDTVSKYGKRV